MKKILLLCALIAFATANVAMAQGITKSYDDYLKYREGNESYEQYKNRLEAHARANKIGEFMERLDEATNGKIDELANGKKVIKTVKIYPVVTPEVVDLGLPSGTQWASMNLGAQTPTEVGNYYAGGEAKPKSQFTPENYKFYDKASNKVKNYPAQIAGSQNDPVFVALGGYWQMPDQEQMLELISLCEQHQEVVDGVNCYRFVGPNGNSILIPFNNTIFKDQEHTSREKIFLRWSEMSSDGGIAGMPVRPVNIDPVLMAESKRKMKEREEAMKRKKIEDEINAASVDLGLSIRWARCNYGASKPTEVGNFLSFSGGGYYYSDKKPLPLSGLTSRMPTEAELQELVEKCIWTLTTEDGVKGFKVTGPNGNSMFIPCGGNQGGFSLFEKKSELEESCYLIADKSSLAGQRILIAKRGSVKLSWGIHGYNVRPVYE